MSVNQKPMMIGHILIGLPGSGKSSFARELAKSQGGCIISTDQIRGQLYGDERIQGSWEEIQAQVDQQFDQIILQGKSPIYDATNVKRVWRISLLQQLQRYPQMRWIGWYVQTPLNQCLTWNQRRSRHVPEDVIQSMNQQLINFPPWAAEGFFEVIPIHRLSLNWEKVNLKIEQIRQQSPQVSTQLLHPYAQILDFERLMNLLSILLDQPQLQQSSQLIELSQIMVQQFGIYYADLPKLSSDLTWLKSNHVFALSYPNQELCLKLQSQSYHHLHPYSKISAFSRLIKLIRFLIYDPFHSAKNLIKMKPLIQALTAENLIQADEVTLIYQDIKTILIPYQLLRSF